MIKVDNRESAHLKSRVIDKSVVPNVVSYTGLFAAITPIAKLSQNENGLYDPILIRDTDSLIANFGDPRVDPEKYIDLYSIMQIVGNGTSCYVAKVPSGDAGTYELALVGCNDIIDATAADQTSDIEKITDIDGFNVDSLTDPSKNFVIIDNLHNDYNISNVSGEISAKPATATINGMTFTAKTAGESENGTTIQVVKDEVDDTKFNIFVNGVKANDTAFTEFPVDLTSITATGTPVAMASAIELSNGADDKTWDIASTSYSVINGEDLSHANMRAMTIYIEDGEIPEKIFIGKAVLDPDYGIEQITFNMSSDDNKVYISNTLDRKYTLLELTSNDVLIDPSNYIVDWLSVDGDKYKAKVTLSSTLSAPLVVKSAARQTMSMALYSSTSEELTIRCSLTQAKPTSLKLFYLNIEVNSGSNQLGTAKIKLEDTTTNQGLVNAINSILGTYVRFELVDESTAEAAEKNNQRSNSIVYNLLNEFVPYQGTKRRDLDNNPTALVSPSVTSKPNFKVTLQDYIDTQMQYKDHRYDGCLMADMTALVTHDNDGNKLSSIMPLDPYERRALHYNLKQVACERKDCSVILSTPYYKSYTSSTVLELDDICDWVASTGNYTDLWEYGTANVTDYSLQSFYLEIYYSWLNLQCTKLEGSLAKSVKVKVAPANLVTDNILRSFRERGVQYPVAGDQFGTLTDQASILKNPKSKLERDQLVQYRINPIWDTGTRGIQIYGNETLNAGYTDLNAAHIARTLIYIRSVIDEYTESLKFLINSQILWDTWKNYVTMNILQPLQDVNAVSSYRVRMGNDTTTRAEIANRRINGIVELTFYQSAEIFDLSFIVYSSSTTVEEANPL